MSKLVLRNMKMNVPIQYSFSTTEDVRLEQAKHLRIRMRSRFQWNS